MPSHPFSEHRNTRLWAALEASVNELIATRELTVNTDTDYVVDFLCQELIAKKLVADPSPR